MFSFNQPTFQNESHLFPSVLRPQNITLEDSSPSSDLDNSSASENNAEWDFMWGDDDEVPFQFPVGFQIVAHIFYNIIMVLGLIGNGCVLLIFTVRRPQFRKLPTPLLANLAVGDLLITVFCLETGYLSILWQYWPFGKFLCYAVSPVKPVAVFVSCYTLIALSVDRYLGVKNPLRSGVLSQEKVKWTVGAIWVLAVITSLPVGIFTSYETHLLTGLPRCGEYDWESELKEMIYDLTLITLQFFAPLLVLIYTYTKISIVVCKSKTIRQRMSHGTSPRHNSLRTVRMSLMVVLGYTLAWLPFNVVMLLAKYSRTLADSDHFPYIFIACHFLGMSHAVYNPIIYFWLNESFRVTVKELFCRGSARNSERRRMSSTHLSWRNSTLLTSYRSSISRPPGIRLKQVQVTPPILEEPPSYLASPLLATPATKTNMNGKGCVGEDEATKMNEAPKSNGIHQTGNSESAAVSVLFTKR